MATIKQIEQILNTLINQRIVKLEDAKGPGGNHILRLTLGDPNRPGSIAPQYIVKVHPGDTSAKAIMRRILFGPLNLSQVRSYPGVDHSVIRLLEDAQALSRSIEQPQLKDKFEASYQAPITSQVDVYHLDSMRAVTFEKDHYGEINFRAAADSVMELDRKGFYQKAATVTVSPSGVLERELHKAYEATQNIDNSWTDNEGVTCHTKAARSSMVGDVMVYEGKAYIVANLGFKPLESFSGLSKGHRVDKRPEDTLEP